MRIEKDEVVAYVRRQRGEPDPPRPDPVTRAQIVCLHARADDLDRKREQPRGTAKAAALAAAGKEFGRELESSRELTIDEASWVIDWLTDALVEADAR